jgi:hypothetical protein
MSETRMVFYRYRSTHGDWSYQVYGELPVGQDIDEDELEEIAHDLLHSRGFRRATLEQVERPPQDWLIKQIDRADRLSHHYAEQRDRLWSLLHRFEADEMAQWESGRMVEWCATHCCELAQCAGREDQRNCVPELRACNEPCRDSEAAPVQAG